jgi:[CysO sulfur-carrier protein]-S-L-cysteine hydrolase
MSGITLPQSIYHALLSQARALAPIEACGILAGRDRHVHAFHPMTNTEASVDHFIMDPREQFAVVKAARAADQEVLAIHHSHPATPARPSAEDIRLAVTPGVIYTILSLADPDMLRLKGFSIEGGVASEIPVTIAGDADQKAAPHPHLPMTSRGSLVEL